MCLCGACLGTSSNPHKHSNTLFFSPWSLPKDLQAPELLSESCVSTRSAVKRVVAAPSHFSALESSYSTEGAGRFAGAAQLSF